MILRVVENIIQD